MNCCGVYLFFEGGGIGALQQVGRNTLFLARIARDLRAEWDDDDEVSLARF